MKIFGSIEELVNLVFRKGSRQITLKPNQTVTYTVDRNVELPPEDANGILMSATSTATMTNKTFDANGTGNSLSNVEPADFKAESGDADKVLVRATGTGAVTSAKIVDANVDGNANISLGALASVTINRALQSDGSGKIIHSSVTSTELGHLSGVTSNIQTQLDAKVDENAPIVGATATKITFDSKGLVTAGTALAAGDMPSGIDATKIGAGSVDNTEFGYLNGVTSDIQTQINAKADSSTLSAHTGASSGVHGVTGSVVGTSDTQVLTNKDIDGATASDTSRITLPKANKSVLDGLTRKQATLVYGSDTNKVYADDGSSLKEIGSGSSGINYLSGQYGADSLGTVQTSVGDVLASSTRSNPTQWGNSAASALITQPTDSTLRGTTNYLVQYTANAQFVESPLFSIDGEDLGKPLLVQFDVSGVSTSDDVQVYIARYNISNVLQERIPVAGTASATTPFSARVPTNVTTFRGFFIPSSTSTDKYAVRWLRNANNTSMRLDTFFVGPQSLAQGAVVTGWQSYTPTLSAGWGTTSGLVAQWMRVGNNIKIRGYFVTGVTAASLATVSFPSGLTSGTLPKSGYNIVGKAYRSGLTATAPSKAYTALMQSNTNVIGFSFSDNGTSSTTDLIVPQNGSALAASDPFHFETDFIPVNEWSSGTTTLADRAVEEYVSTSSFSSWTTVRGPTGAALPTTTPSANNEQISISLNSLFGSSYVPTDYLILEVDSFNTGYWIPIANDGYIETYKTREDNTAVGLGFYVNAGNLTIIRGKYRRGGGTSGVWSDLSTARFRLRKISSGAAVGFPVSARNIVGDTSGTAVPTGYVGEYVSANSAGGIANLGAVVNVASITLQPGDWDVWGFIQIQVAGHSASTEIFHAVGVSTTSATLVSEECQQASYKYFGLTNNHRVTTPTSRILISSATTVHLVSQFTNIASGVTSATVQNTSKIVARRRS